MNESARSICVQDEFIKYRKDQKFYYPKYTNQSDFKKIDLEIKPFEIVYFEHVNDMKILKSIASKYKYLAVEEELKSIFFEEFGYIKVDKYSETKEGLRWLKIYGLLQQSCDLDLLKSVEIYNDKKQFTNEIFTFLPRIYNKTNIKQLYLKFFKEKPNYVPKLINEKFYDLLYIEVNRKRRMMIDKLLIKYVKDDVLYVGKKEFEGAKNQVIYDPKFKGYPEFSKKEINLSINGYYQSKERARNNFSTIYASKKDLISNEFGFYKNYKRYLKILIYKICIQRKKINFEENFKIDQKFYKLLVKTRKIISNFCNFLMKNDIKMLKKDMFLNGVRWDFYSLEDRVAIDIVLSNKNIDESFFKMRFCPANYWIISDEGEKNIQKTMELREKKELEIRIEDDLFYWNNTIFNVNK